MLDNTIASAIIVHTKSHNYEYSHSRLNLRCEDIICVAGCASTPGIISADNIRGVKFH